MTEAHTEGEQGLRSRGAKRTEETELSEAMRFWSQMKMISDIKGTKEFSVEKILCCV